MHDRYLMLTAFVVQLLSFVQLFVTLWTAACQASLSCTISRSLLKFMSIESVVLSNHLILCCPLLLLLSVFPRIRFSGCMKSYCVCRSWKGSLWTQLHPGIFHFSPSPAVSGSLLGKAPQITGRCKSQRSNYFISGETNDAYIAWRLELFWKDSNSRKWYWIQE